MTFIADGPIEAPTVGRRVFVHNPADSLAVRMLKSTLHRNRLGLDDYKSRIKDSVDAIAEAEKEIALITKTCEELERAIETLERSP